MLLFYTNGSEKLPHYGLVGCGLNVSSLISAQYLKTEMSVIVMLFVIFLYSFYLVLLTEQQTE